MPRRKPPEHENHERWLVSYADFITLLFAFFVVMFATSRADSSKASAMSESVRKALREDHVSLSGILGGGPPGRDRGIPTNRPAAGAPKQAVLPVHEGAQAELLPSLQFLSAELHREIEQGQMEISLTPRGLVVALRQAAFFPSGEDTIAPNMYASLAKVAEAIKKLPNPVRLEGHTDSLPIHNSRYKSNWALSTARAISMLELFTTRFDIPPDRLAVAGYADTYPVESNDTEEGRRHNRRVEIVVLNQNGMLTEPVKASPPAAPAH